MRGLPAKVAHITDGRFGQGVQMPCGHVLLEVLVPRGRVELREPIVESEKLLPGELADSGFDVVNGAHVRRMNRVVFLASAEATVLPVVIACENVVRSLPPRG